MNNKLVVIDPGHGGIDTGAVSNNLIEKNLNLEISKYIYNRLKELNIPVVITREEDEYLPKDERIKRIKLLTNNNPNNILISNHMNAGGGEGVEIVYSLKNNDILSEEIIEAIEEKGQIKRKVYQRRLPENPNKDYYYILRESNSNEPLLIEYGFIDNKNDQVKLKNNLLDYGEAVVEVITNYLGYPYYNDNTYIVQKGDTLYSISKKYNITVEELKRINNLDSNTLSIGQVLSLKDEAIFDIYEVEKGDSLWLISKKFKTTVPYLIEINNLDNLVLQINQKLLVPKREEKEYIVQSGDTLWTIAKNNNLTVNELKEKNNLENNLLQIGQVLII